MAEITWRTYAHIEGVNEDTEIYSYRRKADRENYDLIKPINGGFPAVYRCAKCGVIMLIDAEYTSDVFEEAGWWAVDEESFDPARPVDYFCDRHKYAAHELAKARGTYVDNCECGVCYDYQIEEDK